MLIVSVSEEFPGTFYCTSAFFLAARHFFHSFFVVHVFTFITTVYQRTWSQDEILVHVCDCSLNLYLITFVRDPSNFHNCTGYTKVCPLVWCGNLEREMPAHVSSLSSDRSSKLRDQSHRNPRVASKRDVNWTKLNYDLKYEAET
ncbi:hypothetical protein AVEN_80112-1 [Araneus ventricosus]|uniref:Uncharacterized protein n=1 Tax=Araneus ventricosus TaxID=182803 RepID=A0A4Y2NEA7_ARAVE|nr:hypothetical protein AVEN_80112-1 [Araneus ventricosus]